MTKRSENNEPHGQPEEPDRVVIRDKRKIDPITGEARTVADLAAGEPPEVALTSDAELLLERTADLQRVQAEYANYRKRADRDRLLAGDLAVSRVLAELLPILDDIDRAREHGDLTGGLKAVAEKLDVVLSKLGLEAFGEVGDPFDPTVHEAVMHQEADDEAAGITVPTSTTVMRKGYRHGERLLRAAMVGVTDPATPAPPSDTEEQTDGAGTDENAPAESDE